MTTKRVFYIMVGLICTTALGIIALIYMGNKMLVEQSNKLVDLKATNEVLENQVISLAKAKQNIEKYKNLEELTQTIVPQDKDQARVTREIIALAEESGFKIKSVTFPASNLGTKVAPPPSSENQTQQTTQPAPNPISQAKPVQGMNGVYSLEANIAPEGSVNYYQFISFLSKLEKNRRTAQVTSIKIDPKTSSGNNPQLTFSLTVNLFLKP
jgi:hypothetical protein